MIEPRRLRESPSPMGVRVVVREVKVGARTGHDTTRGFQS